MKKQSPKMVSKTGTFEERAVAMCRRLGIPIPPTNASATIKIRWWAIIGAELAELQPEFKRPVGRPKGFKPPPRSPDPKDLAILQCADLLAREYKLSFENALREIIPEAKKHEALLFMNSANSVHIRRFKTLRKRHGYPPLRIWDLVGMQSILKQHKVQIKQVKKELQRVSRSKKPLNKQSQHQSDTTKH
jgi:hypothetical protein